MEGDSFVAFPSFSLILSPVQTRRVGSTPFPNNRVRSRGRINATSTRAPAATESMVWVACREGAEGGEERRQEVEIRGVEVRGKTKKRVRASQRSGNAQFLPEERARRRGRGIKEWA